MLSACGTTKPTIIVQTELVREPIPAALVRPCQGPWNKPVRITGDFVQRGDVNEAALRKCAAQVEAIKKWDERP